MKLTDAQLRALRAVSAGEVTLSRPVRISADDTILGARKDVVKRLEKMGLVTPPCVFWGQPKMPYTLSSTGQKALEEQFKHNLGGDEALSLGCC